MVDFSHSEKANRALRMIEWKCKIHFRTYTWTLWQYWTASRSDVVFLVENEAVEKSEQQNACWWQHQNIVALNRQRLLIKEYEKPAKKCRTQNNNEPTTEGTNECTKKYCTSNEKMQNRTWLSKMVCIDIGRVWWLLCIVVCYFTHIAMFANVCTVQMTVFACFSLCFGVSPVAALPAVN